jgi:hypothetical integral membrane protein (TIGR02206 family)
MGAITRPEWKQFGPSHLLVLAIIIVVVAMVIVMRNRYRSDPVRRRMLTVLALLILCSEISFYVANIMELSHGRQVATENSAIGLFLPLHLCGAVLYFIWAFALRPNRLCFEVVFCWSFVGGVLAALMPDMRGHNFPDFLAFQMFFSHGMLLVMGVFLVCAYSRDYPLTWKSILRVMGVTLILAVLAFIVNQRFGTNYMFLGGSPAGERTPLDYLSPGLGRIPEMALIALVVFYCEYGVWRLTAGRGLLRAQDKVVVAALD